MRVLLVYPQAPDTFWSFKHVVRFVSKKSVFPPLGLLTVAAMLPRDWELTRTVAETNKELENAVKYLDRSRPGMIRVSGRVDDGQAIYTVEDNGIGIARNHQDKVFDSFAKRDRA